MPQARGRAMLFPCSAALGVRILLVCFGVLNAGCSDKGSVLDRTGRSTHAEAERSSTIKSTENVLLYPALARRDAASDQWIVAFHGKVFEPETDSRKRALFLAGLRRVLDIEEKDAESEIFKERMLCFLVDHERGKRVTVRVGDVVQEVGVSTANGHFMEEVKFSSVEVETFMRGHSTARAGEGEGVRKGPGVFEGQAILPKGDQRRFSGRVHVIPERGCSVISDLDDTIKISHVRQKKELLKRTFLRPFEATPGLAELYRRFERSGMAFHYVSGSPWQLYEALESFREEAGFPAGSFHLKHFRLTDRSVLNLFSSQQGFKKDAIEEILAWYPGRQFVLMGDSGEEDPEIYGDLARAHPEQILRVFIRDVSGEAADHARYKKAFEGMKETAWVVFESAEALREPTEALIEALQKGVSGGRK